MEQKLLKITTNKTLTKSECIFQCNSFIEMILKIFISTFLDRSVPVQLFSSSRIFDLWSNSKHCTSDNQVYWGQLSSTKVKFIWMNNTIQVQKVWPGCSVWKDSNIFVLSKNWIYGTIWCVVDADSVRNGECATFYRTKCWKFSAIHWKYLIMMVFKLFIQNGARVRVGPEVWSSICRIGTKGR